MGRYENETFSINFQNHNLTAFMNSANFVKKGAVWKQVFRLGKIN